MTAVRHEWWGELRHGGMLVAPQLLDELLPELPPLDERAYDRLRAAWLKLDAALRGPGEIDEARRTFAGELLEGFLGLSGWQKASAVGDQFKATAVGGENLRPNWVLPNSGGDGALLAVYFDSSDIVGRGRGVRAHARLVELLRVTGVPLGLLTNGRQFRLVHAGPDYDAWAEWDAQTWFDESEGRDTLRGLAALVRADAGAADGRLRNLIDAIRESRNRQGDLAQVLGEQVRQGVELLVREVDHVLDREPALHDALWADPAGRYRLSDDEALGAVYQAATRLVMRLVLVLYAEARDLLPAHIEAYHDSYGIGSLYDTLARADREGGDAMAEQHSAWPRIVGLCRLIYLGSGHADLPVRAYGGQLFRQGDAQAAEPVLRALAALEAARPSDATVYRLLRLLKVGKVKVRAGRGARWVAGAVDFADLRTEYVGIVYEGLLDYELRRAAPDDPIVLLNVGREPALPLSRLRELTGVELKELLKTFKKDAASAAGADEMDEETADDEDIDEAEGAADLAGEGFTEDAADAAEAVEEDAREAALAWAREAVEAAGLVRRPRGSKPDFVVFEHRLHERASKLIAGVIPPGRLYLVASGGLRKGSGSFYTRPALSVPLAHRSLEPLCYEREGDRLVPRPPEEILSLKVCEPAMGSGSFLVAALRYLVEALHRSLEQHGRIQLKAEREVVVTLPLGTPATGEETEELLPLAPEDDRFQQMLRSRLARHVVERCLYGVDRNPMAVELARLALWVETLDRDLPFEYLDHKLKVGNSLVGCWLHVVEDYPIRALDREDADGKSGERTKLLKKAFVHAKAQLPAVIDRMGGATRLFEEIDEPAADLAARIRDQFEALHDLPRDEREDAYRELLASDEYARVKQRMDTWCALWFWPAGNDGLPLPQDWDSLSDEARAIVERLAAANGFFHWELEFPDAFRPERSGFDVVLGNPPWEIAKPNSLEFFSRHDPLYRTYSKTEALVKQQELFGEVEGLEQEWTRYQGGFKAMGHLVKSSAEPFDVLLARGQTGERLSGGWELTRRQRGHLAHRDHPYRLQGSADLNTYKLFLELGHHLLRVGGRLAMLVPSGIYTDKGTTELRRRFLDDCSWEWCYGFENRARIFPITALWKFVALVVQRGGTTTNLSVAFMRNEVSEWERPLEHSMPLSSRDIRRFAPDTLSFLEFRSPTDVAITEHLYADHAVLGEVMETHGGRYSTEFHMTNDARCFVSSKVLRHRGELADNEDTRDPRVRLRLRQSGYVPLYEGKSFFVHDPYYCGRQYPESITRFVSVDDADARVGREAWRRSRLVFRDVARSVQQRTLTVALMPPAVHGNKAPTLDGLVDPAPLAAVLGSLTLDYIVRMKVSATLNWFYLKTLPVPSAAFQDPFRSRATELVLRLNAVGADFPEVRADAIRIPANRLAARLLLDAFVAQTFSLSPAQFRHITTAFPAYDSNIHEEFRYPRLAAAVYEALVSEGADSAYATSHRLATRRHGLGLSMGFDDLWLPAGGWDAANSEAAPVLPTVDLARARP